MVSGRDRSATVLGAEDQRAGAACEGSRRKDPLPSVPGRGAVSEAESPARFRTGRRPVRLGQEKGRGPLEAHGKSRSGRGGWGWLRAMLKGVCRRDCIWGRQEASGSI